MGLLSSLTSSISKSASSVFQKVQNTASNVLAKASGGVTSFVKSQPARLQNVVATLKSAVTGGGVVANTGNKTVDKILGGAASHPFATASVAGTVANIPKAVKLVSASKAASGVKATNGLVKSKADTSGLIDLSKLGGKQTATTLPQAPTGGVLSATQAATNAKPSTSFGTKSASPSSRKRRRSSSRSTHKKSHRRRSSKKKRYGTAKQYKRKGGKSVKYTKNGQPYIILASGKARFVKGRRRKR